MGNMQNNQRIDTCLPDEGYWMISHTETSKTIYSNMIRDIATAMDMQIETLISLLMSTTEGRWPALIGGKTFAMSALDVSDDCRMFTLKPADSNEIADLLTYVTGDEMFVLINSHGKIIALSEAAVSLFGKKTDLATLFDASSSGAIQTATRKCIQEGSVFDFLVVRNTGENSRSNYTLSMRKLPCPGRLIFCKLTIPSVAVVTQTLDKKGLIGILLEESFCPAIIIDSKGVITSMNEIAKGVCTQMWGTNPTGSSFYEFVHPDHRKTIELRHEQREKGYATTSRFSVKLQPSLSGSEFSIDISVVPIPDTGQYVVFSRTRSSASEFGEQNSTQTIPAELMKLLMKDDMSQSEILEITSGVLGAASAAFVHEGKVLTVGDSRDLVRALDPVQLAASPCGFREDGVFLHRIHSGFSISHLVFQGMPGHPLQPLSLAVLHCASLIFAEQEAKLALRAGHRLLATVKVLAESFLKKTEPLEGILSDLAKECRAETAVVFKINPNGTALKGIGTSGVVGMLPDLQIEALNTASWACIRGETAFFAETPEDDLRFSPVFPDSRSELAVPYFNGSTTDGVILLASTETEAFHYIETELIQIMAILFSVPESTGENGQDVYSSPNANNLKQKALDYISHNITALYSASQIRIASLEKSSEHREDIKKNIRHLSDSVIKLSYFSRWTLWWLKISAYGGNPDHRWIDPVALLKKVLDDFRVIAEHSKLELRFHPPENDIEVCTDGTYISMIAYSLLMCFVDNCDDCTNADLTFDQREDHWSFGFETTGGSIPGECLTADRQPGEKNMAFSLALRLAEELGGTISTFSSKGKSTRMIIRLKVSG